MINNLKMAEEINSIGTHATLSNTDLAFERTMLAHERTLMAWVRTATSMISFGFTIYKFFQELNKTGGGSYRLLSPRIYGMVMILFGLLGLLLAQIQHYTAMKKLREDYPSVQRSVSSLLGMLILVFGLFLFLAALFRQ
jgi:putative membrane protein